MVDTTTKVLRIKIQNLDPYPQEQNIDHNHQKINFFQGEEFFVVKKVKYGNILFFMYKKSCINFERNKNVQDKKNARDFFFFRIAK